MPIAGLPFKQSIASAPIEFAQSQAPAPTLNSQLLIPFFPQADLRPVRASGSRVWDDNGRDYIDLASGIAVCNLGHSHPELRRVLQLQADKLWHISNFYATEPTLALAEALVEATFAERVFFANSGAEAIEAAVKIARRYFHSQDQTERNRILCFDGAFHGRTLLTITLGGKPDHRLGFGPLPGGIDRLPYDDIGALESVDWQQLAAVLVEPIQGESGVRAASSEFLAALRRKCDENGCLLIFDEVQSGNARTGPLFAYMNPGVQPDILATAKGLGAGLPIGAVLTRRDIAEAMAPGSHGTTFGGNPLACAVALRTLELIQSESIRANIENRAEQLALGLQKIGSETGVFAEIRCHGLWAGADLVPDRAGQVDSLLAACRGAGVLALPAGAADVLRLSPALNITAEELQTGLWRLHRACQTWADDQGASGGGADTAL